MRRSSSNMRGAGGEGKRRQEHLITVFEETVKPHFIKFQAMSFKLCANILGIRECDGGYQAKLLNT